MKLYSVSEMSEILKLSKRKVRGLILDHKIKVSVVGKSYLATEQDLIDYIESSRLFKYD